MYINYYFYAIFLHAYPHFYIGFYLFDYFSLTFHFGQFLRYPVNTDFLLFINSRGIKHLTLNFWALGKVFYYKLHCGWPGWITFKELSVLSYTFPREEFESPAQRLCLWLSPSLQDSGMECPGEEDCSSCIWRSAFCRTELQLYQGCAVEGI